MEALQCIDASHKLRLYLSRHQSNSVNCMWSIVKAHHYSEQKLVSTISYHSLSQWISLPHTAHTAGVDDIEVIEGGITRNIRHLLPAEPSYLLLARNETGSTFVPQDGIITDAYRDYFGELASTKPGPCSR